jgi:hypothetical protein
MPGPFCVVCHGGATEAGFSPKGSKEGMVTMGFVGVQNCGMCCVF